MSWLRRPQATGGCEEAGVGGFAFPTSTPTTSSPSVLRSGECAVQQWSGKSIWRNIQTAEGFVFSGKEAFPLDSHLVILQRKLSEVKKAGVPMGGRERASFSIQT